jgi:hypothetical protein
MTLGNPAWSKNCGSEPEFDDFDVPSGPKRLRDDPLSRHPGKAKGGKNACDLKNYRFNACSLLF